MLPFISKALFTCLSLTLTIFIYTTVLYYIFNLKSSDSSYENNKIEIIVDLKQDSGKIIDSLSTLAMTI
jgi:cell division protein FtsX